MQVGMSKLVFHILIRFLRAQPIQPEFSVGFTTLLAGLQKLHAGLRCALILGKRALFMIDGSQRPCQASDTPVLV